MLSDSVIVPDLSVFEVRRLLDLIYRGLIKGSTNTDKTNVNLFLPNLYHKVGEAALSVILWINSCRPIKAMIFQTCVLD